MKNRQRTRTRRTRAQRTRAPRTKASRTRTRRTRAPRTKAGRTKAPRTRTRRTRTVRRGRVMKGGVVDPLTVAGGLGLAAAASAALYRRRRRKNKVAASQQAEPQKAAPRVTAGVGAPPQPQMSPGDRAAVSIASEGKVGTASPPGFVGKPLHPALVKSFRQTLTDQEDDTERLRKYIDILDYYDTSMGLAYENWPTLTKDQFIKQVNSLTDDQLGNLHQLIESDAKDPHGVEMFRKFLEDASDSTYYERDEVKGMEASSIMGRAKQLRWSYHRPETRNLNRNTGILGEVHPPPGIPRSKSAEPPPTPPADSRDPRTGRFAKIRNAWGKNTSAGDQSKP
jgi:hypothetical protein